MCAFSPGIIDDAVAGLHIGSNVLGQPEVWVDIGLECLIPLLPAHKSAPILVASFTPP